VKFPLLFFMVLFANGVHYIKRFLVLQTLMDEATDTVSADSIVVQFNVLEYRLTHCLADKTSLSVNSFHLE